MDNVITIAPGKGRPREFDVTVALAAALRVFWRHGYDGASMTELTREMGITKPSLYAAFGNKEALFHKALDLYECDKLAYTRSALEATTSRGVAERFLHGALAMQSGTDPKGCMAISASSCGPEAESIRMALNERRLSSCNALIERFERAGEEGDLPDDVQPVGLARHLLAIVQGMAVQASAGASCQDLHGIVETTLRLWPGR